MNQPPRIYIVGTNTEIGKTHFLEQVLRQARGDKPKLIPFKPAQSGNVPEARSDAGRLCTAQGWGMERIPEIAPFRYPQDLAPGCAHNPAPFLRSNPQVHLDLINQARAHLEILTKRERPHLILCEGAGGLHVPMPGGTWQTQWIRALATHIILVAPTGLGTINHTILTVDAIRQLGLPMLGIAWTGAHYPGRELAEQNMKIVQCQTGLTGLARPDPQGQLLLAPDLANTLLRSTRT